MTSPEPASSPCQAPPGYWDAEEFAEDGETTCEVGKEPVQEGQIDTPADSSHDGSCDENP
jgi:hypothetical protein